MENHPKDDSQLFDLPVDPNDVLFQLKSRLPTKTFDYFSVPEAKALGVNTSAGVLVEKYGSVISFPDIPEAVAQSVALAVEMAPQRALNKLNISAPAAKPEIILTGGPLRLKSGQRIPAVVDMKDGIPIDIKISLENARIAFGLTHDKPNKLDPIISFAIAVHEVSDLIQIVHSSHDAVFGLKDTDEKTRAGRHARSKSEEFSNDLASQLTKEIFGVTITFGENDERIFTPEPPGSV